MTTPAAVPGFGRRLLRRAAGLGIRGRLALLALALGLPILAYVAFSAREQMSQERELAKERNLAVARIVAARIDDYVGDVNQLLATLSHMVPAAAEATAQNDALLADLRPNLPSHVSNLAIWDAAGTNVGALDRALRSQPFSVADRYYFRTALASKALVVEAPLVSRSSGENMAIFARSVVQEGRIVGVVTASTELDQLGGLLKLEGTLPAGSAIAILDQRGVVLARSLDPEHWIGKSIAEQSGVMADIARREGTAETHGVDGVGRLAGFTTAHSVPWFVYVGVPTEAALAPLQRQLFENLLVGSIAMLMGFVAAGLIGEWIARPLRQLASDAALLARGELGHRSTVSAGGETGVLAEGLNSMAEALQQRALELSRSEERLRLITDHVPAFISYVDRDRRYRFANALYDDFFGLEPRALIGRTVREVRGELAYQRIKPKLDEALSGLPVRFEHVYDGRNGKRTYNVTYLPDYTDDHQVRGVYVMGQDVTEHKALEEKLGRMAQYDQLTGLPNRYLLHDRLAQACARSKRDGIELAVFYLDLNDFKRINDTHGHAAGDAMLQEFARRVTATVRATDTVARLGGDEFVILMEGAFSSGQLEQLARKIVDVIEMPFEFDGKSLRTSSSIGVATCPPWKPWEELLHTADAAMYEAKASGRGAVIVAPSEKVRLAWSQWEKPREAS
ncbi:MAG TPA: diguanylate cyclase [Casimicrobiaceae bacterium]|nr:diguanylate cyclase [Casimicrobiaceae bacterium]